MTTSKIIFIAVLASTIIGCSFFKGTSSKEGKQTEEKSDGYSSNDDFDVPIQKDATRKDQKKKETKTSEKPQKPKKGSKKNPSTNPNKVSKTKSKGKDSESIAATAKLPKEAALNSSIANSKQKIRESRSSKKKIKHYKNLVNCQDTMITILKDARKISQKQLKEEQKEKEEKNQRLASSQSALDRKEEEMAQALKIQSFFSIEDSSIFRRDKFIEIENTKIPFLFQSNYSTIKKIYTLSTNIMMVEQEIKSFEEKQKPYTPSTEEKQNMRKEVDAKMETANDLISEIKKQNINFLSDNQRNYFEKLISKFNKYYFYGE